jgi:hypothetical protein
VVLFQQWVSGITHFRSQERWGNMTCCIENPCISGADQAEARPEQIGAALAAIARRPLRATLDTDFADAAENASPASASSVSAAKPNLAL